MQTRNKSPFKTKQCTDCDCDVPLSTGRDLCSTCDNVKQLCGISPSEIVSVSIEKFHTVGQYGFELTVNGETRRHKYYKKSKRDFRYSEYKSIIRTAKNGCSLCE